MAEHRSCSGTLTGMVARRSAAHIVAGVRRSDGVVAAGIALLVVTGVIGGGITLFSAGFALTPW
ncbi:MAG: hypothetical protein QM626_09575 [Microbacterium sp.]|uniref:hypothetical protein n=1 Tax=Microbacterium sp. TaxID=51671 RepID=UPI0039E6869F